MSKQSEEQTALAVLAKAGDRRALAELMASMQGYVVTMRRRYTSPALDRDDVDQACRVGIMRALGTFDPARGSFGAAASMRMRAEIRELSDMMCRPVKVPDSRPLKLVQWKVLPGMQKKMAGGMAQEQALAEACAEVGVSIDEARTYLAALHTVAVGDSGQSDYEEIYEPEHEPDPAGGIVERDRTWALGIVEGALSEREWAVIKMRVLDGMSLSAVAAHFGVTRERITELAARAIKRAAVALEEHGLDAEALL